MTLHDDLNRMFAEATQRIEREFVEREFVSGGYAVPDIREATDRAGFGDVPDIVTVSYVPAYLPVSIDQAVDAGLITEEAARARGWTPYVPPPAPWHRRLRWRWAAWREAVGRKIGGWISGVDLSERNEDW